MTFPWLKQTILTYNTKFHDFSRPWNFYFNSMTFPVFHDLYEPCLVSVCAGQTAPTLAPNNSCCVVTTLRTCSYWTKVQSAKRFVKNVFSIHFFFKLKKNQPNNSDMFILDKGAECRKVYRMLSPNIFFRSKKPQQPRLLWMQDL